MTEQTQNQIVKWGFVTALSLVALFMLAESSASLLFKNNSNAIHFFGVRFDSTGMEKLVAPDWDVKAQGFLYSTPEDPEYLNPYGYVNQKLLSRMGRHNDFDYLWQKISNYFNGNMYRTNAEVLGLNIAQIAQKHEGSRDWSTDTTTVSAKQVFLPGTDKCNQFVGDILVEAGRLRPSMVGSKKIATANQFADANLHIDGLTFPRPLNEARAGDVIAQDHGIGADGNHVGHCGIIVKYGQTASVNTNIGGQVVVNDWGFRNANAKANNGEENGSKSPPPVVRHPE